jgi:hypothetical protein
MFDTIQRGRSLAQHSTARRTASLQLQILPYSYSHPEPSNTALNIPHHRAMVCATAHIEISLAIATETSGIAIFDIKGGVAL